MTTEESVAPEPDDTRRTRLWAAALAATLLAALLFWFGRTAWGGSWIRETSPAHDTIQISMIYERWAAQVADGHLPLWFPEFAGGTNVHAAWMFGLAYPPLLLFNVLPPDVAWTWLAILHIVFGGLGVYAWFLEERRDAAGAATAAIVFALSGFVLGRMLGGHLNVLMPAAWVPWVLRATLRAARGEPGAVAVLGLCAGVGLLAGHVQVWFYGAPLAAVYGVLEARRLRDFKAVRRLATGALVALGVSAIQWLPAWELFALSGHPPEGRELVEKCSASGSALAGQFLPRLAEYDPIFGHEHLGLAGPLAVAAAVLGLLVRGARSWFWFAVAVLGLTLSTGPTTEPGELLNWLPPFRYGRVPGRAFLLVVLAGSMLAGNVVAAWFANRGVLLRALATATFVASALSLGVQPPETVRSDFREYDWVAPVPAELRAHRLHPGGFSRVPYMELRGARSMRDLCPNDTPGYKALEKAPESVFAWWFDVAGKIWLPWTPTPDGPEETAAMAARAQPLPMEAGGAFHVYDRAEAAPDETALDRMRRGDRALLLETAGDAALSLPNANAAAVRLSRPGPGRLTIELDESGGPFRGFVLLSEKWYPGWETARDGASVHRGNLAFLVVKVVAGQGSVELAYRPWWRLPALLASAASIAAALAVLRPRAPPSLIPRLS